MNIEVG